MQIDANTFIKILYAEKHIDSRKLSVMNVWEAGVSDFLLPLFIVHTENFMETPPASAVKVAIPSDVTFVEPPVTVHS